MSRSTNLSPTTLHRPRRAQPFAAVAALVLALLLAGCRADAPSATAEPAAPSASASAEPSSGPSTALVARASGELPVYESPDDRVPARTLPPTTSFGTPTVVLVSEVGDAAADGWLEALLPVRPNGATGWIRVADVELRDVTLQVEIALADRELVVRDAGKELLTTRTAIGAPSHPTPTGRFYVVDKLETPDPDGAYGPYALGLSAHSDVLTAFGEGDGQVGIHGTNAPTSIGEAVSHGCLRVDNAVIERLAQLLPLGTPVTIS